jgi:hypothetical protein
MAASCFSVRTVQLSGKPTVDIHLKQANIIIPGLSCCFAPLTISLSVTRNGCV